MTPCITHPDTKSKSCTNARGLLVLVSALLTACTGAQPESAIPPRPTPDAAATEPLQPPTEARILAAYHGLDALPKRVLRICPAASIGKDGMPVGFSVLLDEATVRPDAFVVETATGELVTPVCATLSPADEPLERRTVLLAGDFGTPEAPPRRVRVVGLLRAVGGASLQGLETSAITKLEAGPNVLLAERFDPTTPGLAGECPPNTQQVVQLMWEGGVTGPNSAPLGEDQRRAITVTLQDSSAITPLALADDDPDNFVHACLDTAVPAVSVTVAAGYFYDPGDDPNPATGVDVVAGGS